jgi:hypothetical protein
MDKKEKTVRLVDVSELEADLKKELAKEDAKGKGADILFCESIEDELSDLENLPTIDPKSLRPVAHWDMEKDAVGDPIIWTCSNCKDSIVMYDGAPMENGYKYCPHCGARMEDAPYDVD